MDGDRRFLAARWQGGANDGTIINRIMLRFRPIAPKPEAGRSCPGESTPENKTDRFTTGRAKRKYVRAKKNNRCKRNKVEKEKESVDLTVLNRQPSPEISSGKYSSDGRSDLPATNSAVRVPTWLNFDNSTIVTHRKPDRADLVAVGGPGRVAESWVTVECVTDACMEGGGWGLGSTDVERINNLEADTCPGFISDGGNRVRWVNLAYKRMVCGAAKEGGETPPETAVCLLAKVELPVAYAAFACRVRVQYACGKEKCSQTMVPCDVWRMDCGGFAWRLDVNAALSLGR
ncbi:hypothetical protein NMG60_11006790 [Bertholletia excelsa]